MRRTTMVVALAMSVLTVGLLASPAFAAKEKPVFGKFKATVAGSVKGIGEAGEMVLGPYKFEECEKELASRAASTMGESETFFQEVKFRQCVATSARSAGALKNRSRRASRSEWNSTPTARSDRAVEP